VGEISRSACFHGLSRAATGDDEPLRQTALPHIARLSLTRYAFASVVSRRQTDDCVRRHKMAFPGRWLRLCTRIASNIGMPRRGIHAKVIVRMLLCCKHSQRMSRRAKRMSRLPQAERGVGKAISWPTGGLLRRLWRLAMTGVGSGQKTAPNKMGVDFRQVLFYTDNIRKGRHGRKARAETPLPAILRPHL